MTIDGPPWAMIGDNLDVLSQWLWWAWYLCLTLIGWLIAYRRDLRLNLLRWLSGRLPSSLFGIVRRILFNRIFWLAVRTLCLFGVFLLFGSLLLHFLERDVNEKFGSLEEASHSTLIYLFSGIEDRMPRTAWGWRCFGLLALAGVGLTAYFTGYFVSELLTRGKKTMDTDAARQSFLIIGWNPRSRQVIEEFFRAFDAGLERHLITVLSEKKVDTTRVADLDAHGVTFVTGDPFDKKVLERMGAHQAHSVIILANKAMEDPDGNSAMTVLALSGLFKDKQLPPGKKPRVCVEVANHRKNALIRDAGADETICHEDFGLGVLAQSALIPAISQVYQEMLTYAKGTNEFYVLRGPNGDATPCDVAADIWDRLLDGKTFPEAADVFNRCRDDKNPVILVGLRRDGRLVLNPREIVRLRHGDELMVISYTFPSLEHFRRLM